MSVIPESSIQTLARISECVQAGKADAETNIPPGTKGQPGVVELVQQMIAEGLTPQDVLHEGLMPGLQVIGKKFAENEVFIPEVLIAARAMQAGMALLKPLFNEGDAPSRGVFVMGTVAGDLHDIGKNLVCMMVEGAGWTVVDLGVDCKAEKFLSAIQDHPGCAIGLSALLTTTMTAMRDTVTTIHEQSPDTVVVVGGAPITESFALEIGASAYARDPAGAIEALNRLVAAA